MFLAVGRSLKRIVGLRGTETGVGQHLKQANRADCQQQSTRLTKETSDEKMSSPAFYHM